jgi:biotin carboxylase
VITPFFKIHTQLGVKGLDIKYTPTHVIAGTEAGVFLASALRRFYNLRRSSETLLTPCTDKTAMKKYLSTDNIPMAGLVTQRSGLTAEEIVDKLGLPVVVKDRKNSGGRNVVIAKSREKLSPLLAP